MTRPDVVDHFDLPNDPEPGTLKVGIISSNHPKKGIEQFVELAIMAARRRPELEFLVFGPHSEYTERLEWGVRSDAAGAKVRFAGCVADPLETADAFVMEHRPLRHVRQHHAGHAGSGYRKVKPA